MDYISFDYINNTMTYIYVIQVYCPVHIIKQVQLSSEVTKPKNYDKDLVDFTTLSPNARFLVSFNAYFRLDWVK